MEVHLFTLFSRLAQTEKWTKTKDFNLSCNLIVGLKLRYLLLLSPAVVLRVAELLSSWAQVGGKKGDIPSNTGL